MSIEPIYRGSVKEVLGPVSIQRESAYVFRYTDAFSVFDWGRLEPIAHKGQALAILASYWFEQLGNPETWKKFSASSEALALRKANRFGGAKLNSIGEELQKSGLTHHYLGALDDRLEKETSTEAWSKVAGTPHAIAQTPDPFRHVLVRAVQVTRPDLVSVLNRKLYSYPRARGTGLRLIPLEVVFRFKAGASSSIRARLDRDPNYLESLGFSESDPGASHWDFPIIECFTKLESTDRVLGMSEALGLINSVGGGGELFEQLLLQTAWVAAWLKWDCARKGLELWDGKLEWAIETLADGSSRLVLVDAIGPDELRLCTMSSGKSVPLSKEFLRNFYRDSAWYQELLEVKAKSEAAGVTDWKRLVKSSPPKLGAELSEKASQLYRVICETVTERKWFESTWTLNELTRRLSDGASQ
jgi:phosphoribosylaminoimidazole-succinocarboxamide synthase